MKNYKKDFISLLTLLLGLAVAGWISFAYFGVSLYILMLALALPVLATFLALAGLINEYLDDRKVEKIIDVVLNGDDSADLTHSEWSRVFLVKSGIDIHSLSEDEKERLESSLDDSYIKYISTRVKEQL